MPKRVDHEERRRQIADALLRTAAVRGLHATGMREVAAEAGVSLRLVQYYFGTKEELLLAAMQHLAARFAARATARFREASGSGGPANPRDVIAAILAEGLPADDESRTFHVIYTAYLALSLTDPALAIAPLVKNSDTVTGVVAAQLRSAQAAGDTPTHLDPDLEAFSLMAMSAGLATSVLAGQSSAGQAQAVIDYHLVRLFPASRPALHRGSMNIAGTGRGELAPVHASARAQQPVRVPQGTPGFARANPGFPRPDLALGAAVPGRRLAVKLGERGVLCADGPALHQVSVPAVAPADTTGAGDCFNAGLIAGLLTGLALPRAAALGCAAGALSARAAGGTASAPDMAAAAELASQATITSV